MVEVYNQPAIIPVSATLKRYVNNTIEATGTAITKVNIYEVKGQLETGTLGVIKKAQISQTDVVTAPKIRDRLTVGSTIYVIESIKNCNYSPVFKPFWELEIKSTTANV